MGKDGEALGHCLVHIWRFYLQICVLLARLTKAKERLASPSSLLEYPRWEYALSSMGSSWISMNLHTYMHICMHIDIQHVNFVWILENQLLSYLTCTEALPANFQHYKKLLFTMICLCGCVHTCGHTLVCVCMWCIYTIYIYTHLKKDTYVFLSIPACLAQDNLNLVLQRNNWKNAQPIYSLN